MGKALAVFLKGVRHSSSKEASLDVIAGQVHASKQSGAGLRPLQLARDREVRVRGWAKGILQVTAVRNGPAVGLSRIEGQRDLGTIDSDPGVGHATGRGSADGAAVARAEDVINIPTNPHCVIRQAARAIYNFPSCGLQQDTLLAGKHCLHCQGVVLMRDWCLLGLEPYFMSLPG